VGVYYDTLGQTVAGAEYTGRCLAPDATQFDQLIKSAGDFALVIVQQLLCGGLDRFGLAVVESSGIDILAELLECGFGVVSHFAVLLEKRFGNNVDPLISTLGRENRSDHQLVNGSEVKRTLSVRVVLLQEPYDLSGTLGFVSATFPWHS